MARQRKLRLSRTAQVDIEKIDFYSFERWGETTAASYMAGLEAKLNALTETPMLGVERSNLRSGYRALVADRHVIYYRIEEEFIYILTILHHSRDHTAFLSELHEN